MNKIPNPQIDLAYKYVNFTNKHIFLTGNAGTGKTTFLRKIKKEANKRLAVVAPTGVAAINAKGVTIHSLFQLPFGPLVPGQTNEKMKHRFSKKKINLLKSLDLLIIDEISMVRADVLDAIDEVLRRYRRDSSAFGGVQLLMIGDLHQLPPVVKQNEWSLLKDHYSTLYFFGSQALQKTDAVTIELKHIYRQADVNFINLLNKVRSNQMSVDIFEKLNSRYQPDFQPADEDGYITLTSHNRTAQEINAEKLEKVDAKAYHFKAEIDGKFPENAFPNHEDLTFKVGAQVMFIKNDISMDKLYYNGKIGHIVGIGGGTIRIQCPDEEESIVVGVTDWENVKYSLDEKTKELKEKVIGTFTQYPLKLAWAITIHKSQGLTFERVVIDAAAAFAHGQVYVALSRCKSFEGIVLRSKIGSSSVKTDSVVQSYTKEKQKNEPSKTDLLQAKRVYQQGLLFDLFNFKILKYNFSQLHRTILENESSLIKSSSGNIRTELEELVVHTEGKILTIAEKFIPQLHRYFAEPTLPEENEELQERIGKASLYFSQQLKEGLDATEKGFEILSDNKAVKTKIKEKLKDLKKSFFIKHACFLICTKSFKTHAYIETQANAELDFEASNAPKTRKKIAPRDIAHPVLYKILNEWRARTSAENDVERYSIMPTKTLIEIVEVLPTSSATLKKVHGIGPGRMEKYGVAIIDIVNEYCLEHELPTDQLQFATGKAAKPKKPPKPNTKLLSFEAFQDGKSIEEIAKERGLVNSTIYGHLAHYVGLGQLDISKIMEKEKVMEISSYLSNTKTESLSDVFKHFGGKYSYSELRMVAVELKKE